MNRIDWSLKQANREVFEYYRGLIALRRGHPVFRLRSAEEIRRRLEFLPDVPGRRCLAYTIDGAGLDDEAYGAVLVLLNGEAKDQEFKLPAGRWQVLADADRAGMEPLAEAAGTVLVRGHSGMVLGAVKRLLPAEH